MTGNSLFFAFSEECKSSQMAFLTFGKCIMQPFYALKSMQIIFARNTVLKNGYSMCITLEVLLKALSPSTDSWVMGLFSDLVLWICFQLFLICVSALPTDWTGCCFLTSYYTCASQCFAWGQVNTSEWDSDLVLPQDMCIQFSYLLHICDLLIVSFEMYYFA